MVFLSLYCSKFNYYNDYRNLNKKPKVDVRQKFKVFVLRNGESVERVVYGFPVECFVINEHAPIRVFTSDSGNSSDFFFWTTPQHAPNIALSLHGVTTIGAYSLFDHFAWVLPGVTRADDVYTASSVFISMMTNTRACCFVTAGAEERLGSLCAFMKNATWVERESSEMLDLIYSNLADTRKLLLDYSTERGVLHKSVSNVFSSHFFKNYYFVNYDIY